ncbi:hypothetical protein ACHABX_08990 [Nesterenkonia halotolerans]|uniref:hypothetical protein n=1 Tax=Nesterenkonia halotolerans TaxID=225325 RepID=UPI003EE6E4BA
MQRKSFVLVGLCALFLVSGCGQDGTGVSLLEESASTERRLPADLYGAAVKPDSAQFLAEHEGVSYFLGRPTDPGMANGVCLVAMEAESTGCSGPSSDPTRLATLDVLGTEARVVRDGADVTDLGNDGWTQVHENLLVR